MTDIEIFGTPEPEDICELCNSNSCSGEGACLLIEGNNEFTCEVNPSRFTSTQACAKDVGHWCGNCGAQEVYLSPLPNIASMGTCVTNDHFHGTARWSNDCPGLLDGRPVWERGSAAHFTQWAEVTLSGPSFVDQVVVHQLGGSHLVADLELFIVHGDGTESVLKTGGFAETQIVDVQQNDVAKVIIRLMPGGTRDDWIRMTDIEIFGTPEPEDICELCNSNSCSGEGACLLIEGNNEFTCEVNPSRFTSTQACAKDVGHWCGNCGEVYLSPLPNIASMGTY